MLGAYTNEMILGFSLSLIAGLSTGIGAAVAFFLRKLDYRILTYALGASAGMMVYISFMEFMPSAIAGLEPDDPTWAPMAAFFGGALLIGLIDRFVPSEENPHEVRRINDWARTEADANRGLKRSALLFALAIAIHNFPEGIATMVAAFEGGEVAYSVAFAVAIHNIPEGIAVAIPLYCATQSRWKSFGWAALSGLAEPIGALVAMLLLLPFLTPLVIAMLFAAVAGIMVFISLDELLPMAQRWGFPHASIYGVMSGMLVIALIL